MKLKTLITLLLPLFFIFISLKCSGENGDNANIYTTNEYYTAGSIVRTKIGAYAVSLTPFSFVTDVKAVYELKDAFGNVVYKWTTDVDYWNRYYNPVIHMNVIEMMDENEIKIPNMMGFVLFEDRPEGRWEIEAYFDVKPAIDLGEHNHFVFNVYRGNLIDNLFAPIYIYKGYRVFGIEIANFHAILPPIGYLILPILIIIVIILIFKYMQFSFKETKKFISQSRYKIRSELKR